MVMAMVYLVSQFVGDSERLGDTQSHMYSGQYPTGSGIHTGRIITAHREPEDE